MNVRLTSVALIVACLPTCMVASIADGQTPASACSEARDRDFPQAVTSMGTWERERGVRLGPGVKQVIVRELCTASKEAAIAFGVTAADIDDKAPGIIVKYLEDNLSSNPRVPSISQVIAVEFGLGSAPSLPEMKVLGLLRIAYLQKPDRLRISGRVIEPWPKILIEVGTIELQGLSGNRVVCSASLSVTALNPIDFRC